MPYVDLGDKRFAIEETVIYKGALFGIGYCSKNSAIWHVVLKWDSSAQNWVLVKDAKVIIEVDNHLKENG